MVKVVAKKAKPVRQENEIAELMSSIKNTQEKIGKLFEKQIEKSKKQIAVLTLKKDKAKAKSAKVSKGKAASKVKSAEPNDQSNELVSQKLALKTLEAAYKKWKAEQKTLSQFEKEWQKKEKQAAKKGRAVKAKKKPKKETQPKRIKKENENIAPVAMSEEE